jgi:dolichyl-phosphate-mannose-protein mannosyltransferase
MIEIASVFSGSRLLTLDPRLLTSWFRLLQAKTTMAFLDSNSSDPPEVNVRPSRGEVVVVALIVACGFMLRAASPTTMAVEHFDEGVYASNNWFSEAEEYRYPFRHLYAPPLLPFLLEWTVFLFESSHWGTMLVGIFCGGFTVAVVWWVARQWFGVESGIAAAVLAAFSDFHILYSRTALTDVPLSLSMLLAVYFIWEAYRTLRLRWILAAGIATGLGWWTKYNGWLPLAVGLAGLIPWVIVHKHLLPQGSSFRKLMTVWIGITVTAVMVWSPVWMGLQSRGGYQAVSENHGRYLVGLDGWFDSLIQQWGNHRFLEGWLTCAGVGLALFLAGVVFLVNRNVFTWNTPNGMGPTRWIFLPVLLCVAILFAVASAYIGTLLLWGAAFVAGVGVPLWKTRFDRNTRNEPESNNKNPSETILACWLLAAWFVGLLLATPFYYPYPRLTLPWLIASWLGAAAAIPWVIRQMFRGVGTEQTGLTKSLLRRSIAIASLSSVTALVLIASPEKHLITQGVPGWQNRTGIKQIAEKIVQDILDRNRKNSVADSHYGSPNQPNFVIDVYGEPAIFFHLSAIDDRLPETHFLVQPVAQLNLSSSPKIPMFLVTGPQAHYDSKDNAQLKQLQQSGRFEKIADYLYHPSDLVLLNRYHPAELAKAKKDPTETVSLYLLK